MRRGKSLWIVAAVLLFRLIGIGAVLAPAMAHAADCSAGRLVTVVAHLDDDLLFVNPGISDKLDAGWCVTTVHLIGGANGAKFDYVRLRETGTKLAYARMAGVRNEWTESTVDFAGKPVHEMVLKDQPKVRLLELRLPGGAVRGGRVPLGLLWDQGETLTTYPMNDDGSGPTSYDRSALVTTLRAILTQASEIYTLNPDTVPFIEHPDHIYAARITRVVAQSLDKSVPIGYHVTYPTGGMQKNLNAADTQRKRDAVGSYFAIDGGDAGHVFGEYQWDGNWVARRYWTSASTSDAGLEFRPQTIKLVNEYSSQCLSSGGGADKAPLLTACTGAVAQDWHWQPVPTQPGEKNDAQLVNEATKQCVAERDGGLVEEACNRTQSAQKWTPWDFGLVYTPLGHCLGEKNGAVSMGRCSSLTAEYRWAPTPHSQWTDLREEGAMYGDVKGEGRNSVVYVLRRKDGPGFNVWVAEMSRFNVAAPWYLNAVHVDPHQIAPTCTADSMCFDSARFLLGDFEGNGRADLMVVTPRNGGTAFWLMRSTGKHFDAPRLWYQTTSAWTPETAQQYVAADFTGDGRASVMIAQQRGDAGLNLWVLTGDGATGRAPSLWLEAKALSTGTRFLPARLAGSPHTGLLAIENVNSALTVTQLASSGSAFSGRYRGNVYAQFPPAFTKVVSGDVVGDGVDDLVALQPRSSDASIDVWAMKGGKTFGQPVHVATLRQTPYADAMPALVRANNKTTLLMFKRANSTLGDYYFTGGAPSLVGYDFDSPFKLGPAQIWGELPGLFSEALWLKTLTQ